MLGFLDEEISGAFQYFMRQAGITLRLGEKVEKISELEPENGQTPLVQAELESGKKLRAETLLYAVGRQGVCSKLDLENVGIEYDDRERLHVNEHYQTNVEHVYAAGDVIGFPALASTSMEQGRRAICHAFGCPTDSYNKALFPFGIYAVPEISMVGKTEEQLTEEGIPYEAGIAQYDEIARGKLLGDDQAIAPARGLIQQRIDQSLRLELQSVETIEGDVLLRYLLPRGERAGDDEGNLG